MCHAVVSLLLIWQGDSVTRWLGDSVARWLVGWPRSPKILSLDGRALLNANSLIIDAEPGTFVIYLCQIYSLA